MAKKTRKSKKAKTNKANVNKANANKANANKTNVNKTNVNKAVKTDISKSSKSTDKKIYDILFIIIIILGVFVRIYKFGSLPDGINQDEAFAGYEAFSLLHYGKDSFGYGFPVYFISWGSGMNVLNSYLMIPFIAVFGLKSWVIRLPQLIVAVLTLIIVYLIMKKLFHEKAGLVAMFILAVVPWHIMLARWGLESNLAPGFLMLGLFFFIKGMEKSRFYIVSAVMYGMSLYCYATIWPFVPLIIVLEILYAIYTKTIKINKDTIISFIVLAVMSLPLLLFLLINTGHMEEIKFKYFSIPKLLYMRSGEISLENIPDNFKNIWNILIQQTDGLVTNVYDSYGIFYKCTLAFFAFGVVMTIYRIARDRKKFKNREAIPQILLIIQFLAGFLLTLTVTVNVNRANCLIISIILIAAYGLYELMEMLNAKYIAIGAALLYLIPFSHFANAYFSSYNDAAGYAFSAGFGDAMECAEEYMSEEGNGNHTIYVTSSVSQARVLFYSKIPVDEYLDTVVYNNFPGAYIGTDSFGCFQMNFDIYNPDIDGIYIVDAGTDTSALENTGFEIQQFGYYIVAYMTNPA